MNANVGGIDKMLRIAAGLAILSLVVILEGSARWWGLVGLVPFLTGLFGVCPAHSLLGIRTCPAQHRGA